MSVFIKIIHTAIIDKTNPQVEVRRRLTNYRNTPHSNTSSELIMGRLHRTKTVTTITPDGWELHLEAMLYVKDSRKQRKQLRDRNKKAVQRNN